MRYSVLVLVPWFVTACGTGGNKSQDHNSSRSNKSSSIIVQPDSVLPMAESSALSPSCVEVLVTAGEDDPEGRASGDPIHGVDVKLGCVAADFSATASTDSSGIATFCDLSFHKRGAFVLTAEVEGALPVDTEPVLVVRAPRFIEWIAPPSSGHVGLPLRSSSGACPAVQLRSGEIMPGTEDGSSSAIAYRAGDPIHGVDVKLGHALNGAVLASATTDEEGVATFCDLIETASGATSYEPWTDDDLDQSVVSNPLYQSSSSSGVNPMFEGRNAVSPPVRIGGSSLVITFSRQPPAKAAPGVPLEAEMCPIVLVGAAAGFSDSPPFDELMGAPAADISVTITAFPEGSSLSVTTGADGTAALCNLDFGDVDGAYNLQASAPGARPVLSWPLTLSTR